MEQTNKEMCYFSNKAA